jgi:hypothetical protein
MDRETPFYNNAGYKNYLDSNSLQGIFLFSYHIVVINKAILALDKRMPCHHEFSKGQLHQRETG